MRQRVSLAALSAVLLVACGGEGKQAASADSMARDLELAPVAADTTPLADAPAAATPAPAPAPATTAPARQTPRPQPRPAQPEPRQAAPAPEPEPAPMLAAGTSFEATARDTITSRKNKAGEKLFATVSADVKDSRGRTIVPAGSVVELTILELKPAENKDQKDGKLRLASSTITVKGESYTLSASVDSVERFLKGRGVTAGDAAKVGAGAAVGAVAGRIIGGNKTGTIVGGAVGAAAGTAVAVQTADRDVVIPAGAKIILTLKESLAVN